MINVISYLDERKDEFDRHLAIAQMLEARVDESVGDGEVQVEIRHINALKSGLLIHLYNIVEATTTQTLKTVGQIIVRDKPKRWKETVLKEWLRAAVWSGEERIGDPALKRLIQVSGALVSGDSPDAFVVKGEPGSWNDKSIKKVADRLGCKLIIPRKVAKGAYEKKYLDEKTAMAYLADRRNAIAHGNSTFEDGASGMTLVDLKDLSQRILPYLRAVSESYKLFLEGKHYLK